MDTSVAIMRGGTSRGVVLNLQVAPEPGPHRDELALKLIGRTPVEGLGGGSPVTNKVVLVGTSSSDSVDLDYIVGNVSSEGTTVDWSGTCGNMTSAVLPFACVTGMSARSRGSFRLRNLATDGLVDVTVADDSPAATEEGAEVRLSTSFLNPAGLVLGQALPTGRPRDVIEVGGESFDFTLLDVTHPYLFLSYEQVIGHRALEEATTRARVESIRGHVCVQLGLCAHPADAASSLAAVPRVVLVHERPGSEASVQITAVSMGRFITSVPVTAALSLAAARLMRGTIVAGAGADLVVAGPTGSLRASADVDPTGHVHSVSVERTARMLLRGHIPNLL